MNNTAAIKAEKKKKINILHNKPLIGLIIFSIVVTFLNPRFLSTANILNVLRQTSINAIIAAGMTFVILTGGIDLSVGSVLALCGAISASLLAAGSSALVAILVPLALGAVFGMASGMFISFGKLQAFITTLVTMTLLRGATLVFTEGMPISIGFEKNTALFDMRGAGTILGIPTPIYIMLAVYGVSYYVLNHTKFGRYVYAVGGNEEATRLSGINVDKVKVKVYAISGLLSALAGIIVTSRLF